MGLPTVPHQYTNNCENNIYKLPNLRYYVQYVSGYDAIVIRELAQQLQNVSDDDSIILSSFCSSLAQLNLEQLGWMSRLLINYRSIDELP